MSTLKDQQDEQLKAMGDDIEKMAKSLMEARKNEDEGDEIENEQLLFYEKDYSKLSPGEEKILMDRVAELRLIEAEKKYKKDMEESYKLAKKARNASKSQKKYKSMRAYIKNWLRVYGNCEEFMITESQIASETNKLVTWLGYIGVDKIIFKRGSQYFITEAVAKLFDHLLGYYSREYETQFRTGKFKGVDNQVLVELGELLADAVYDTDLPPKKKKSILDQYVKITTSPAMYSYMPISQVVEESIIYWKESLKCDLTEDEWDRFAQDFEYTYRYDIRPDIVAAARKELEKFCEKIDKEYRNDETELSENLKRGVLVDDKKTPENSEKLKD